MCAHSIMVQRFRTNLCRWHYHLASTSSAYYLPPFPPCIWRMHSHFQVWSLDKKCKKYFLCSHKKSRVFVIVLSCIQTINTIRTRISDSYVYCCLRDWDYSFKDSWKQYKLLCRKLNNIKKIWLLSLIEMRTIW